MKAKMKYFGYPVAAFAIIASFLLSGCYDLLQENPNQQTVDTFWETEEHVRMGLNAAYQSLQEIGVYGRWLTFAYDGRSDIAESHSPWTDLSNFNKFTFTSYDFEVNITIWRDHYHGIFRANQVIHYAKDVPMDPSLKERYIAEARFIRALLYFNLVTLYGNIPLITEVAEPGMFPEQKSPEEIWQFLEQELNDIKDKLPITYPPEEAGRATAGAATALLGKVYLQQRKWELAAEAFEEVINSPAGYDLLDDYSDNFDGDNENDKETIFEVQFTDNSRLYSGAHGNNIPRMVGPCGVGFCDLQPTRWYFEEFFKERTVDGKIDPRLNATIFWNNPEGMDVYGVPYVERYGPNSDRLFWKKYTEYWRTDQPWDSPINFKVIRFADVLLMYAEALNELGRTSEAYEPINRVRRRVNLPPLEEVAPNLTQEEMRERIAHERILELGLEGTRWHFLQRHNMLSNAYLPNLIEHDNEFRFFVPGKSELLPIPQSEVDLNPNVNQNPGW